MYTLHVPTAIDSVTATLFPADPDNTLMFVMGIRNFNGRPSQVIRLANPGVSKGITIVLQRQGDPDREYIVIAIRTP